MQKDTLSSLESSLQYQWSRPNNDYWSTSVGILSRSDVDITFQRRYLVAVAVRQLKKSAQKAPHKALVVRFRVLNWGPWTCFNFASSPTLPRAVTGAGLLASRFRSALSAGCNRLHNNISVDPLILTPSLAYDIMNTYVPKFVSRLSITPHCHECGDVALSYISCSESALRVNRFLLSHLPTSLTPTRLANRTTHHPPKSYTTQITSLWRSILINNTNSTNFYTANPRSPRYYFAPRARAVDVHNVDLSRCYPE